MSVVYKVSGLWYLCSSSLSGLRQVIWRNHICASKYHSDDNMEDRLEGKDSVISLGKF